MLERIELRAAPEVRKLIQQAFPTYKKHNAFLSAFPESGVNINSYWDGGSRDYYVLLDLQTGNHCPMPTRTHPYFEVSRHGIQGENESVAVDYAGNITLKRLPEGFALVQGGVFCGKTATAHVYLNSANFAKLLTA